MMRKPILHHCDHYRLLPHSQLSWLPPRFFPRRRFSSPTTANHHHHNTKKTIDTNSQQQAAYDFYRRQREANSLISPKWWRTTNKQQSREDRNIAVAWYATAVVMGALAATYAAVPLYKVFCQTTGFGGTTQRFLENNNNTDSNNNNNNKSILSKLLPSSARVHTWTDEEAANRLAQLKPVANADLITVRFDTTIPDDLPWSFVPVQLDVKVVPGETALSFFRVTNHSPTHAITGVATYNVHPPKVGLYFQKIQCFCFEEQRLLPGETVDMPVFFFIDPDMLKDPQVSYVKSVTLSYTFFQTDAEDDDDDDDDDDDKEQTEKA